MRYTHSQIIQICLTGLLLALLALCTGCVSKNRYLIAQTALSQTKFELSQAQSAKNSLEKGYVQMSERAEQYRLALLSAGDEPSLRKQVEEFLNHPHTCKHKDILRRKTGISK